MALTEGKRRYIVELLNDETVDMINDMNCDLLAYGEHIIYEVNLYFSPNFEFIGR
jgi:hypothetical protein